MARSTCDMVLGPHLNWAVDHLGDSDQGSALVPFTAKFKFRAVQLQAVVAPESGPDPQPPAELSSFNFKMTRTSSTTCRDVNTTKSQNHQ